MQKNARKLFEITVFRSGLLLIVKITNITSKSKEKSSIMYIPNSKSEKGRSEDNHPTVFENTGKIVEAYHSAKSPENLEAAISTNEKSIQNPENRKDLLFLFM